MAGSIVLAVMVNILLVLGGNGGRARRALLLPWLLTYGQFHHYYLQDHPHNYHYHYNHNYHHYHLRCWYCLLPPLSYIFYISLLEGGKGSHLFISYIFV